MEATKETYLAAVAFAAGHDEVIYETIYNGMAAYWIHDFALDGTCSGYPLYVLVDKDLNCRFSTPDDALKITAKRK